MTQKNKFGDFWRFDTSKCGKYNEHRGMNVLDFSKIESGNLPFESWNSI